MKKVKLKCGSVPDAKKASAAAVVAARVPVALVFHLQFHVYSRTPSQNDSSKTEIKKKFSNNTRLSS